MLVSPTVSLVMEVYTVLDWWFHNFVSLWWYRVSWMVISPFLWWWKCRLNGNFHGGWWHWWRIKLGIMMIGDDDDWLEPKEKCLHHISSDHPKKGNHQQQATKPDVNHLDLDIWSNVWCTNDDDDDGFQPMRITEWAGWCILYGCSRQGCTGLGPEISQVSNRVKHPHWADSKLVWNRTLMGTSPYINWLTIWSQNRNLEELNCANFSQSWCLRLEKHLQVSFLNRIRFFKNQLEYVLPRFWGSHTLSGQGASLGTWYWYFWMGDHSGDKCDGDNTDDNGDDGDNNKMVHLAMISRIVLTSLSVPGLSPAWAPLQQNFFDSKFSTPARETWPSSSLPSQRVCGTLNYFSPNCTILCLPVFSIFGLV